MRQIYKLILELSCLRCDQVGSWKNYKKIKVTYFGHDHGVQNNSISDKSQDMATEDAGADDNICLLLAAKLIWKAIMPEYVAGP